MGNPQCLSNTKVFYKRSIRFCVKRDSWYEHPPADLLKAFWKGTIPGTALYAAYGSIEFRVFKSTLLTTLAPSPFIRGAIAAGVATTLTYPLDIIRTRSTLQARYSPIATIVSDIYCKEGGLSAFYRGMASALVQVVPQLGVAFGVHAELREGLGDFWAGALGGVAGKTVVMPLDVVRRRYQVHWSSNPASYAVPNLACLLPASRKRLLRELAAIATREGIRGLFAGWIMAITKAASATAITFAVYGWCERVAATKR